MSIGKLRKGYIGQERRGICTRRKEGNSYKYDRDKVIYGRKGLIRKKGVHRGRRGYTEGEGGTQREKRVHRGRRGYTEGEGGAQERRGYTEGEGGTRGEKRIHRGKTKI